MHLGVVQLEIAVQPDIGQVGADEVVKSTIDGAAETAGRTLEASLYDKEGANLSSNTGPVATPPVPAVNSSSKSCGARSALELDVAEEALIALSATGRSDQGDLLNFELEDDEARDRMTPEQIMAAHYARRG